MPNNDIIALVITGIIVVGFIILAMVLVSGKGLSLIVGLNTSGKTKYDEAALGKFLGKI